MDKGHVPAGMDVTRIAACREEKRHEEVSWTPVTYKRHSSLEGGEACREKAHDLGSFGSAFTGEGGLGFAAVFHVDLVPRHCVLNLRLKLSLSPCLRETLSLFSRIDTCRVGYTLPGIDMESSKVCWSLHTTGKPPLSRVSKFDSEDLDCSIFGIDAYSHYDFSGLSDLFNKTASGRVASPADEPVEGETRGGKDTDLEIVILDTFEYVCGIGDSDSESEVEVSLDRWR